MSPKKEQNSQKEVEKTEIHSKKKIAKKKNKQQKKNTYGASKSDRVREKNSETTENIKKSKPGIKKFRDSKKNTYRKESSKNILTKEKKKKTKIGQKIFMGIIFSVGLGLFAYPLVSNLYANFFHTRVIDTYQKEVNSKSIEKKNELKNKMTSYNNSLSKKAASTSDPFGQEKEKKPIIPKHKVIDALEKELGEVVGVLILPTLESKLPIYSGSSDLQLQKGVGVLEGTSLPIGGKGTHSVITGHRGLPSSKLFTDLPKLTIGDQFTIDILGEKHLYEVDRILTVLPQETKDLQVVKDKDYVTLLTCTPYMINTHRLLVRGHRIPTKEKKEEPVASCDHHLVLVLIAFSVLLVVLVYLNKQEKKEQRMKAKKKEQRLKTKKRNKVKKNKEKSSKEDKV